MTFPVVQAHATTVIPIEIVVTGLQTAGPSLRANGSQWRSLDMRLNPAARCARASKKMWRRWMDARIKSGH